MDAAEAIHGFLRRAARRLLLRRLLTAAAAGAAANVLLYGLVRGLNGVLAASLYPIDIGLPLFGVLAIRALWRGRGRFTAGDADRELGLKDRLVSFLDFSRRLDLDQRLCAAQAWETTTRIGTIDLRRGLKIHVLLWGLLPPAVIVLMFSSIDPWISRMLRTSPGTHRITEVVDHGDAVAPGAGERPEAPTAAKEPGSDRDVAGKTGPKDPDPEKPATDSVQAARNRERVTSTAQPPETGPAPRGEHVAAPGLLEEPAQLYSETVGERLTPVAADATNRERSREAPPATAWRGNVSFRLAPQDLPGGPGRGGEGGGRTPGLEITIDFNRVPPAYRDYVRRYFERLQAEGG